MSLSNFFRLCVLGFTIWASFVFVLSLFGDEPVTFFPIDSQLALFPPLYRYEILRLTLIGLLIYFSLQHIFAPNKTYSAARIVMLALFFLFYTGAIKIIPDGHLRREGGALLATALIAGLYYFVSRPRIKKIFHRR
jgi:hypothetical protein